MIILIVYRKNKNHNHNSNDNNDNVNTNIDNNISHYEQGKKKSKDFD